MNGRRLLALWRRVLQEIRRDHVSMALLFIAPVVLTGLLAFIFREGQSASVSAALVNQGGLPGAAVSTVLRDALEAEGATVAIVADEAAARALIDGGTATLGVILSAGVGAGSANESASITLITSGLNVADDGSQIGTLQRALFTAIGKLPGFGMRVPTLTRETLYGSPTADTVDNLAPVIIGFFAYFFVYILTGVSFLRERTGGTLERLLATPVTRGEIVGGYTLGFGLFATLQVIVLLCWALADIRVPALGPLPEFSIGLAIPIAGSPVLAFLVVLLLALGAVSLGIFLSTFARTELQVIQFIPIVIVPQALLAGVLFPVSSLPEILQPLAAAMPLNYAVDGLRQVFIRGADIGTPALQLDLVVLAGITVFFAAVASRTIRREVV